MVLMLFNSFYLERVGGFELILKELIYTDFLHKGVVIVIIFNSLGR